VSQQQRDALDQLLRDAPLDLGGDVAEQRIIFEEMMAANPVPADVTTSSGSLGGIPVVNVEAAGADHVALGDFLGRLVTFVYRRRPEVGESPVTTGVGDAGLEPATSALSRRRSPS
jgi:hypothetical protein